MAGREIKASVNQCLRHQRYLSILWRYQKHTCWNWPHTGIIWRNRSVYQRSCSRNHHNTGWESFQRKLVQWHLQSKLHQRPTCGSAQACNYKPTFPLNGALYEQVEGVAMGSPLGSLLANTFMCSIVGKLEEKNELPSFYKLARRQRSQHFSRKIELLSWQFELHHGGSRTKHHLFCGHEYHQQR